MNPRQLSSPLSRSNKNLEILFLIEGGKPENPEKNPRSKDENQQQAQPTYDDAHWWEACALITVPSLLPENVQFIFVTFSLINPNSICLRFVFKITKNLSKVNLVITMQGCPLPSPPPFLTRLTSSPLPDPPSRTRLTYTYQGSSRT